MPEHETPMPPVALRGRDVVLVIVTALSGLLASGLTYNSFAETERLRQEEVFQAAVLQVRSSMDQVLSRTIEAVRSAGLMVESQQELTRLEFLHYAQQLAIGLPALGIIEWQPWVRGAERAEFERLAQAQGLEGYRIIEPGDQETAWQPAAQRPHYVPVLYGWPEGQSPLGFDLAANPLRMSSKLDSARRRLPMASISFPILKRRLDAQPVRGFAISSAVIGPGDNPRGFMAAVVELPVLMAPVQRQAREAGLELRLYEGHEAHGTPLFGAPAPGAESARPRLLQRPGAPRGQVFQVADPRSPRSQFQ